MSYHHPFSPSSLGRRRLCPGSFLMEQKVKKPKSSEYAAEGTMLHECIATRIIGRSWDQGKLNSDQLNALENSYEWFRSEILIPLTEAVGPDVWKMVEVEKNLGLWEDIDFPMEIPAQVAFPDPGREHQGTHCVISGTVDVLIDTQDGYAVIVDWKFGRAEVSDVSSMLQLMGYALLAFNEHEHIQAIEAYIYQPRLGSIKKGHFDREDIELYKESIGETIAACKVSNPPLAASQDACAYCNAIAICPEAKEKAFEPTVALIERPVFDLDLLNPDEFGIVLDEMKVAEKFLSALKIRSKEAIMDGCEATGWAISERGGIKSIHDAEGVLKALSPWLRIEDLLSISSFSQVDFEHLPDILSGQVSLHALLPYAKVSVPKLINKLTERIQDVDDAIPKVEARRHANALIGPYMTEGPRINALSRRKDK